jgi:hypothetical protein
VGPVHRQKAERSAVGSLRRKMIDQLSVKGERSAVGPHLGLTAGMSVMLFAFGPAVFFLFLARWRKLHPRWQQSVPADQLPSQFRCPKCNALHRLEPSLVNQLCYCEQCGEDFFIDRDGDVRVPWFRAGHWRKPAMLGAGLLLAALIPLALFPMTKNRNANFEPEPWWQVELRNKQQEIDRLRIDLVETNRQLRDAKADTNTIRQELTKTNTRNRALETELRLLQDEIQTLKTKLANAEKN